MVIKVGTRLFKPLPYISVNGKGLEEQACSALLWGVRKHQTNERDVEVVLTGFSLVVQIKTKAFGTVFL